MGYNGENADGATVLTASDGGCPEGTVDDCSGDGDCCGESWIGDGWCDGEDQAWGCDLTCYDNDGGDCEDTEPEDCDDGYVEDCADDDCCPESVSYTHLTLPTICSV